MIWAWWMIGIFLSLQLVLLGYLLISKAKSLRYEALLQEKYEELLPLFIAYAAGEEEQVPALPKEKKIRREVLELILERMGTITEESSEQERLLLLAEQQLLPAYERALKRGSWSSRMNTLYFIEDFHLQKMSDKVYHHLTQLHEGEEEYRQALRTLASLGDKRAVEILRQLKNVSITFIKEILRRFDEGQLQELRESLHQTPEDNELLWQAFIVHVGERHLTHFLEDVEKSLQSKNKEIRLKAMKSISFYQFMMQPELIKPFFHSDQWEERMYACKVTASLSNESWREELMLLLGDPVWWVRFAAAETLRSFSDGLILLEYARVNHKDRYARDMAGQTLAMQTEVTG